jgi:serine/threonine-protein kinase HipA
MKQLLVYMNGQVVGVLTQDKSGLVWFKYADDWLSSANAIPVSYSLPLQREAYKGKKAATFFAGMLPEEGSRDRVARILGISKTNNFGMLERIGGECAGALSLLPEDQPYPTGEANRVRALDESQLREVVGSLANRPLLAGETEVRLSLAGAQAKLPVVMHDDRVCVPLDLTPSTHILKPEPAGFPGLVANESFCMNLARAIGLNVPRVTGRMIGEMPCIFVQRYDRMVDTSGKVARVHQEDFCQALGFPPEKKYQQEGGPLVRDCINLVRQWMTVPAVELQHFLDALIFNVLIGNADAHGKNYSILYPGKQRQLTPLYDLVCTLAWPDVFKVPAMKIGKADRIDSIAGANWQALAEETKIGWPMLRQRITEMCHRVNAALPSVHVEKGVDHAAIIPRVRDIISRQVGTTLSTIDATKPIRKTSKNADSKRK